MRFGPLAMGGGVLISLLVVIAMVGDFREVPHLARGFHWPALVWMALLALLDHGLRYWRWEKLLRRVGPQGFNFERYSGFLLFSMGSLLIFTPARVGEVAKSVYARDFFGVPIAASLPILVAERLADLAVMAALAGLGLLLLGETSYLWLAVGVLGAAAFLLTVATPMAERLFRWKTGWLPWGGKWKAMLASANASRRVLFTPGALAVNLSLGSIAWMVEVSIYFGGLTAVGATAEPSLFLVALAVFPLASLGGSLSLMPGGLGMTEVGLVGLGVLLGGLPAEVAVLAALLTRATILGVVVVAGLISMGLLRLEPAQRRVRPAPTTPPSRDLSDGAPR
jgi:uncharacterized membrane protein YbhN (UPF0104 family)